MARGLTGFGALAALGLGYLGYKGYQKYGPKKVGDTVTAPFQSLAFAQGVAIPPIPALAGVLAVVTITGGSSSSAWNGILLGYQVPGAAMVTIPGNMPVSFAASLAKTYTA